MPLYTTLTLTVLIIQTPIIVINRTRVDRFEITIIVKKKKTILKVLRTQKYNIPTLKVVYKTQMHKNLMNRISTARTAVDNVIPTDVSRNSLKLFLCHGVCISRKLRKFVGNPA